MRWNKKLSELMIGCLKEIWLNFLYHTIKLQHVSGDVHLQHLLKLKWITQSAESRLETHRPEI